MMPTRGSLVLLAGLAGCTMYYPVHRAPPRPVVIVAPAPRLVVIAGSDIRYCEECDEDVFFYMDVWWVYRYGGWYRCRTWGDPWLAVELGTLPPAFSRVPPGHFRHRWGKHHPAHDHHPGPELRQDDGSPAAGTIQRAPDPAQEVDQPRDKDKDKERGKSDGKGRGKKRGHGPR